MNIGIDIRPLMSSTRTGVGEYTYEFLNAIFKIDQQNQYFLFYNSSKDISQNIPKWKQENVHYVATHWPNKFFNASIKLLKRPCLDKLICHCEEQSPDSHQDEATWQSHGTKADLNPRDCDASLAMTELDIFYSPNLNFTSLSKKTKHIITIHDLSFKIFPEFYSLKQRLWHKVINPKKQCRHADLILTPSENTKRDVVEYYGIDKNKIKVLYPGISSIQNEQRAIKNKYDLPKNFILFLGTIEPRKNIIGLIEAFENSYSLLSTPHSLIIAGAPGWNNKDIFNRINQSKYKEYIKFIDYVDPEDKSTLYSMAKLFVYPSFYEGFGFPVLEAMASGTPVITSNRSSLPEITQDTAYLINPNKTSEISQAMVKLLGDEKLYGYFKDMGLKQAEKFKWERMAEKWMEIIMSL